jgi:prepilin-type N-terminal cleavage/methylation domain-containing protein
MNRQLTNKNAFTLAEVLITLLIIGVIASMVIPGLIADTQQTEYKTAWKKAYADLSQATKRIMTDNAGNVRGIFPSSSSIRDSFAGYLNTVKSCNPATSLGNCWGNSASKMSNGTILQDNSWWNGNSGLVLNNGTFILFDFRDQNCQITGWGKALGKGNCAQIYVDVNGSKEPNTIGKDVYWMHLTEDALYPFGTQGDGYESACSPADSGIGCAAKYLSQ